MTDSLVTVWAFSDPRGQNSPFFLGVNLGVNLGVKKKAIVIVRD